MSRPFGHFGGRSKPGRAADVVKKWSSPSMGGSRELTADVRCRTCDTPVQLTTDGNGRLVGIVKSPRGAIVRHGCRDV